MGRAGSDEHTAMQCRWCLRLGVWAVDRYSVSRSVPRKTTASVPSRGFRDLGEGGSPRGTAEADVKCNDPIRCAASSRQSPVEGWKHVCSRRYVGGGVVVV
jgi:hypothetical protein